MYSKLQYISQGVSSQEHFTNIQQVLDAGCGWIQLRIKQKEEALKIAEKVKMLCKEYNAVFIINDYVEIAKEIDADGIHLGLKDVSIADARKILGDNKIIGGTANSLLEVKQRIEEKCDYIGLGPYRFTETKENLSPIIGLEGYKNTIAALPNLNIPIYAIGGIGLEDLPTLLEIKIYGVAMSGAITKAINKQEYINDIKKFLK